MAADCHTEAFPDDRAEEWKEVRRNVNVLAPADRERIGQPGIGYQNRTLFPEKYS